MHFEILLIVLTCQWILHVTFMLSLYRWRTVFILVTVWVRSMHDHYGSIAIQMHSGRRYMAGIMPIRRKLHPINQSFKRMVTLWVRLMLGSCTFYLSALCVLIDQSSLAQPNPPNIRIFDLQPCNNATWLVCNDIFDKRTCIVLMSYKHLRDVKNILILRGVRNYSDVIHRPFQ